MVLLKSDSNQKNVPNVGIVIIIYAIFENQSGNWFFKRKYLGLFICFFF